MHSLATGLQMQAFSSIEHTNQLESKQKHKGGMSVQKHQQESKKWNLTEGQGRGFLSRLLKTVAKFISTKPPQMPKGKLSPTWMPAYKNAKS